MISEGDEVLEVAPRSACDTAQLAGVLLPQGGVSRHDRTAQPPGHKRGGEPRGQERQRDRQCMAAQRQHTEQHKACRSGSRPHLPGEYTGTLEREQSGGPRGGRCRGFPLEKPALGDDQANEGQHDRMHHFEGVVGQQNNLQEDLRSGSVEFRPHVLQEHHAGLLWTRPTEQVHERREHREAEHREPRQRPGQR